MSGDARVWLIEDNAAYRDAVARVLAAAPGFARPRAFAACEDALAAFPTDDPPDLVLTDLGLPGMSGLDGIPRLRAVAPNTPVVVLTVFEDDDKIFRAICGGAVGYLLKLSPIEDLTQALREVLGGGSSINARIARRVVEMFGKLSPRPPAEYSLTDREREVLELMVQGFIKKKIAARLDLSVHTVDSHIRNIYGKLHVHTRSGGVAKALREKIV